VGVTLIEIPDRVNAKIRAKAQNFDPIWSLSEKGFLSMRLCPKSRWHWWISQSTAKQRREL